MKNKFIIYLLIILMTILSFDYPVYARIHEASFDDLSDYYSTEKACKDADDDCKSRAEYKFYLKMYDLYYLYKTKYKVKLDLPLIMSTLFYNNDQMNVVFKMNLSDYDRKTIVESDWNPSGTTELDWDYDYESKDNYLVSNDSSMDMQVLAKNMVLKTTTQKCVKDGKTIKSEEVKDTEEDLKCGDGETLEKGNSTYKLDLDKYDDFLLEYIEKKYYLGRKTANPVQSNGPDYVNHSKSPSVSSRSSGGNNSGSNNGDSGGVSNQPKPLSPTGNQTIDKLNQIALGEVGNGPSKYWSWYGSSGDWCAMFVLWLFNQVDGIDKYVKRVSGYACDIPRESDKAGLGVWYEDECSDPSTQPKAGDVVVFDPYVNGGYIPWPANGGIDKYWSSHVGYVYKVDENNIYTVEGNSNNQVQSKTISRKKCGGGNGQGINGYFRPYY